MASTNKTSLGLNRWEPSDKPVREDFVNDNVIIDQNLAKLKNDLVPQKITTLTASSEDIKIYHVSVYRHGKLVVGSFRFTFTETPSRSEYRVITTLPAEFRPARTVYLNVIGNSGNSQSCYIDSDGNLNHYVSAATLKGENFTVGCNFGVF